MDDIKALAEKVLAGIFDIPTADTQTRLARAVLRLLAEREVVDGVLFRSSPDGTIEGMEQYLRQLKAERDELKEWVKRWKGDCNEQIRLNAELLDRINAQIEFVRVLNLDHDAEVDRIRGALEFARDEIQHEPELAGCLAVIDNALTPQQEPE